MGVRVVAYLVECLPNDMKPCIPFPSTSQNCMVMRCTSVIPVAGEHKQEHQKLNMILSYKVSSKLDCVN